MSDKNKADRRAEIAEMAVKSLKDHALTAEGDGRWYCGKPGTGYYSFRVITSPGCVFMHGDLGEIALICHDRDSLQWLKTSTHMDYALGKASERKREFLPSEAERALKDIYNDRDDNRRGIVDKIRDSWEWYSGEDDKFSPEMAFRIAYRDATGDCEVPDCTDWDGSMIWQWHALRKFVELLG